MNSLVFCILTVYFVGECVNGVKIQFFNNGWYHNDLHYESNSTAKCNNMPENKKDRFINSIKTDTCLMIYSNSKCKGFSRKFDLDNTWDTRVQSFHTCNDEIGGDELKIDITNRSSHMLESYRNVCFCINVPQYVQIMSQLSIYNYGNDYLANYLPNCSENQEDELEAKSVPAGLSHNMPSYELIDIVKQIRYKIQSIGPNPNSKYFKTGSEQIRVNNQTMDFVQVENDTKVIFGEDLQNLDTSNDPLEKKMDTLSTETPVLKNTTVALEPNQEKLCSSLEDSIEKLKIEFDNFFKT